MKEGWEYKKLIDVCDFQGGSQPPKSEWINHDSPGYIRMLQIRDFTQSRKVSPEYVKLTNRTKCCFSDDILIGRYGASLGKILTGIAGAYNVAIMRTIPNETLLSKGYLKYYLMSSIFQSFLFNIGGRAAQAGFNKEDLKCLNIPLTTLDEQRRIVSYLDSSFKLIDEIKNKALKSLTEAKALFQSALAEAMEPKEGWEEKTLGEICFIARGGSPRPIKNFLTEDESGIPWIKIGDTEIGGKFINCTKEKIKKEGIKSSRFVRKGDFLLSNSMSFGRPYILKTDGCIHDGWLVLQNFKDTFIDDFLYYLLSCNYVQKQFDEYAYGSTVRNLKTDSVSRVSVNYPPLPTQKQIVSHLDKLSSKVRAIEEKYQKMVEECNALKQAMLRDVFE